MLPGLKPFRTFRAMITKYQTTISPLCALALGVAAALTWGGCGQNPVKLSSQDKLAFQQASPEIQQVWQRALAADKANDYLNAQTLLNSLGDMELNEGQKQALGKEREAFNQRLWQAAEKNDPAAVKAVQASQKNRRDAAAAPAQ